MTHLPKRFCTADVLAISTKRHKPKQIVNPSQVHETQTRRGSFMSLFRRCFPAIIVVWFVLPIIAAAPKAESDTTVPASSANKIRLLVLTDANKLLTVHYLTKGRAIRNVLMTAPIGGLGTMAVDAAETKHETSKESKTLQNTVGEFNRRPVIEAAIVAGFKEHAQYFEIAVPPDPSVYMTGTNINFSKAQADGFPYLLSVKEKFAGEATVLGALGTLSAGSSLEFKVVDTATGKEIGKTGRNGAFSPRKQEFDPATSDRNAFVTDYGVAVKTECARIYGILSKQGTLHAMAEAHGLGNEVPDMGAVLAKYQKRFDYDFKLAKGWHHFKGTSKYSETLSRLGAGTKCHVVVTVDLTLPELGQKTGDLDEYIRLFFERLQEQGYATDAATPFKGLALDPAYTVFLIDRPQGVGKEILAFRRLEDPFVALYDVVFEQDYDGYMAKYSSDFQEMINESRIKIRQ